jgi:hypothetical protein
MEKRRNKSESEISEKSLFLSLLSLCFYILKSWMLTSLILSAKYAIMHDLLSKFFFDNVLLEEDYRKILH